MSASCRCSLSARARRSAHLAAGLAEEITTALARFRWIFVVASNSLARFAAETRDETAIRRTFGIDFLVDGSIQRERNRLRITVRLLDLRAGNQVVWATPSTGSRTTCSRCRMRSPLKWWRRSIRRSC